MRIYPISYQNSAKKSFLSNKPSQTQNDTKDNKPSTEQIKEKKSKSSWKLALAGITFLALVTDIVIERKLRLEEKAKAEALKNEKEYLDKLFKESEEKSKNLEDNLEAIGKLVESLKSEPNSNNSNQFDKYKYISEKIEKLKNKKQNKKPD